MINSKIIEAPIFPDRSRLTKNAPELRAQKILELQEEVDRISVEGKFGNCKRKGSLQRVMAKLAHTSESMTFRAFSRNCDKIKSAVRMLRLFQEALFKTSPAGRSARLPDT